MYNPIVRRDSRRILQEILNAFGMTGDNIHKQAREISSDLMRVEKEAIEAAAKMSETEGSVQQ